MQEERDASNALALSEQETCEKLVFLLTDKESTIEGLREELREAQEVLSRVGMVWWCSGIACGVTRSDKQMRSDHGQGHLFNAPNVSWPVGHSRECLKFARVYEMNVCLCRGLCMGLNVHVAVSVSVFVSGCVYAGNAQAVFLS